MVSPCWLQEFRHDVYSQTGEDGVIGKVLELLPEKNQWCVEFGAWDGESLSNTRYLIENRGYSAVLIEGNQPRFEALARRYSHNSSVYPVNQYVGMEKNNSLDHILQKTTIPTEFDFLSIDIDGNDYHTWAAVDAYQPKLVCIEFNPTIPPEISFVQPTDPDVNQGSSLSALVELGKKKGYELIAALPFNAIFVKDKYFHLFGISNNDPAVLWPHRDKITYIYSGYDGTIFLDGCCRLPWHRLSLSPRAFQRLPRCLRKYPGNYGLFSKTLFALYILVTDPVRFVREVWRRLQGRESTFE